MPVFSGGEAKIRMTTDREGVGLKMQSTACGCTNQGLSGGDVGPPHRRRPQSLYASEGAALLEITGWSLWRCQPRRRPTYTMAIAPSRAPATAQPMPMPAAAPELTPEEPPEVEEAPGASASWGRRHRARLC